MRVETLHEDVLVVTSLAWQTSCTLVKSGSEAFAIDSPVFPDELDALRQIAAQAGFDVVGLVATHADWDHLLGSYAFPDVPLGVAELTATRIASERDRVAGELLSFDSEHYIARPSLEIPQLQHLPVPGVCELGSEELQLVETRGHTVDGLALRIPWAKVVVCGDYLSPVEIPTLEGGSIDQYLSTLALLEQLIADVEHVIPGHGTPLTRDRAVELLEQDHRYLTDLQAEGEDVQLPPGRDSAVQQELHISNVG